MTIQSLSGFWVGENLQLITLGAAPVPLCLLPPTNRLSPPCSSWVCLGVLHSTSALESKLALDNNLYTAKRCRQVSQERSIAGNGESACVRSLVLMTTVRSGYHCPCFAGKKIGANGKKEVACPRDTQHQDNLALHCLSNSCPCSSAHRHWVESCAAAPLGSHTPEQQCLDLNGALPLQAVCPSAI